MSVQRGSFTCAVSVSTYACSCLMGGGDDEHMDWFLMTSTVLSLGDKHASALTKGLSMVAAFAILNKYTCRATKCLAGCNAKVGSHTSFACSLHKWKSCACKTSVSLKLWVTTCVCHSL